MHRSCIIVTLLGALGVGCKFLESGHCIEDLDGFDKSKCIPADSEGSSGFGDPGDTTSPTTGGEPASTGADDEAAEATGPTTMPACETGCECIPGETRTCGSDIGECEEGIEVCEPDATWSACLGGVAAVNEVCDGLDNDCNDTPDDVQDGSCECSNSDVRDCGTDIGECTIGTQICSEGLWGACSGVGPVAESCDGLDNNCDEFKDEGLLNACGTCGPEPKEICDHKDNDCDDSVDEGVKNACGTCGAVPAEVCDCVDNNCNNSVDEGTASKCGMGIASSSFSLIGNTTKQVMVNKPAGYSQYTPIVIVDEYDSKGEHDNSYSSSCVESQSAYTCTLTTSDCDNGVCVVRGRVLVAGFGANADVAYSGGGWQVINEQQNKQLGTLSVDTGPSIVIASPATYAASEDDDFSFKIEVSQVAQQSWKVEGTATGGDNSNSFIKVQASVLRLPCSAEAMLVDKLVAADSTTKVSWPGHPNAIPLIAVEDYNAGSDDFLYWKIQCAPEGGAQVCSLVVSADKGNSSIKFRGYLLDLG